MSETPLADATAAPKPFTINGRTLDFHPLELGDYGAWDRWARTAYLRSAYDAAAGLDGPAQRAMLREAQDAASRMYFGSPRAMGLMMSIEGKLQVLALSLSHGGKPVKPTDTWALFCNAKGQPDVGAINDAFSEVLVVSGLVKESALTTENPQMALAALIDLFA